MRLFEDKLLTMDHSHWCGQQWSSQSQKRKPHTFGVWTLFIIPLL